MIPKVRTPESRRMITLEVRRNTKLTPTFSTITLAGAELEHLKPTGFDQTVRLFFPAKGRTG